MRQILWDPGVTTTDPKTVTMLLHSVGEGEASAHERLWELIYEELRNLARGQLANEAVNRKDPSSLVHEAYIKLLGNEEVTWENRAHFFAAAAQAMRRILVDEARHRKRLKRGGGRTLEPIDR